METIQQRTVVQRVFESKSKALPVVTALVGDNFQIGKDQFGNCIVQYEKEVTIIMDGECQRIEQEETEKLSDNPQPDKPEDGI